MDYRTSCGKFVIKRKGIFDKVKDIDKTHYIISHVLKLKFDIFKGLVTNKYVVKRCNTYFRCKKCQKYKFVDRCSYYHLNNHYVKYYNYYESYLSKYYKGLLSLFYEEFKDDIIYYCLNHIELKLREEFELIFGLEDDDNHKYYKNILKRRILRYNELELYKKNYFNFIMFCVINDSIYYRDFTYEYNIDFKEPYKCTRRCSAFF